ncbi:adenylate cyclase [Butyrivibrio sp. XB500-5]|uniref:adenylate/guanylate cyclase domain-containing protein n=1 Tax=Butyrivibrio sp. XB500-5 TaxID=2364880 RepID=UPI000EA91312|nr:adenylate/guanylate cyclase domain-containing protein [Butyrivibrio sp. XB500-5]RKM56738.1 adenylate cyclase [Butyrivibrio sp. XB500-5]
MSVYDFREGKKRIEEILYNELEVIDQNKLPSEREFTFNNGYYSWVSSIFIDIRNSTALFNSEDKVKVARIIRCFTSEIIEILRNDENLREIGIRGDCVYGIYTTPNKNDEYEMAEKAFYINTFIKMLNKLLMKKGFDYLLVGIGVASAQELVVKAGRKDTGINNQVWIGKAVSRAANLSSIGNKEGNGAILFSELSYRDFIDKLVNNNGEKAYDWFERKYNNRIGYYYSCNLIDTDFNNWINEGMYC